MKLANGLGILLVIAVIAAPLTASAQSMTLDPFSHDFGDVVVGESATTIIRVVNDDGQDLTIEEIEIVDESHVGAFQILSPVPPPPIVVPDGDGGEFLYYEVVVQFTPVAIGAHSCSLRVAGDALPPDAELFTDLQGWGVSSEPASEAMAAVLDFYENGGLVGQGNGNSAPHRLRALGNMLDSADDLIAVGDYEAACDQLNAALRHADGEDRPPDFVVDNDARVELEVLILHVMSILGC